MDIKDGKKVSSYDDYTGSELEALGWFSVSYQNSVYEDEVYGWLKDNTNIDNEVRWIDTISIFFRKWDDAVAFKLRWI